MRQAGQHRDQREEIEQSSFSHRSPMKCFYMNLQKYLNKCIGVNDLYIGTVYGFGVAIGSKNILLGWCGLQMYLIIFLIGNYIVDSVKKHRYNKRRRELGIDEIANMVYQESVHNAQKRPNHEFESYDLEMNPSNSLKAMQNKRERKNETYIEGKNSKRNFDSTSSGVVSSYAKFKHQERH